MIWILVGVVVLGLVGSVLFVRSLSHDVAQWHVDPVTAPEPSTPNSYRVVPGGEHAAPVFDVSPNELSGAFDRVVAAQPRIEVLADDRAPSTTGDGGAAQMAGTVTWVQRSALFGFPDYISAAFLEAGERDGAQSTLAVFSRSRLGQSDLGVNEKRVTAWLAALDAEVR